MLNNAGDEAVGCDGSDGGDEPPGVYAHGGDIRDYFRDGLNDSAGNRGAFHHFRDDDPHCYCYPGDYQVDYYPDGESDECYHCSRDDYCRNYRYRDDYPDDYYCYRGARGVCCGSRVLNYHDLRYDHHHDFLRGCC